MCSRVGFRVMAWTLTRSRQGLILEERLRRSGVREGQTVLDYACGPGYYTIPAARMLGPTGRVYGLDIQPAAAAMVRDRARVAGIHNVTTVVSGRDTGLPAGSVDLVLLYDAIAGIMDKRGVLAELDRVLKPAGVLSVWVEHRDPALTLPLITENSRFVLRVRMGDILNFTREESRSPAG
ncbi:MAG: class I SAM-dependent methyltransferase [Candidatus Limnocylindrales bacterium]|jgi:ubiquinone/menaquinone biosynthesis C-methylase UbiE